MRKFTQFLKEEKGDYPTTMFHLAADADFKLDPTYRPTNNTTLGGDWPPGIFLTPNIEYWVNGHGYWRPWVVEFSLPEGMDIQKWGQEYYIPAKYYPEMKINRVLPIDAWAREMYGEPGWVEEWSGKHFDTGKEIPPNQRFPFRGYQYPGDARKESPEWRNEYADRVERFREQR